MPWLKYYLFLFNLVCNSVRTFDMLYDYRVVMEFTPTGNMFPSLTARYHFTFVHVVYLYIVVEC